MSKEKALKIIEDIVSCDIAEDIALKRVTNKPITEHESKWMADVIGDIYKLSHATNGRCKNPHLDWISEIEEAHHNYD